MNAEAAVFYALKCFPHLHPHHAKALGLELLAIYQRQAKAKEAKR